jgi:glycosyltransferase involved in cell wall biosynthesis
MKDDILLSICIPTYNRINLLPTLVNSILQIQDDRFDICVTDNGSTDESYEWLLKHEDDKLHVFRNEKNYGYNNFVKCLYNADGKYALMIVDRDEIIAENIVPLLDFLSCQKQKISLVSCAEGEKKLNEYRACYHETVFDRYMGGYPLRAHPSGIVYNMEYVRHYNPEAYYIYGETGFPECFLAKDVMTEGISVSYELPIYRNGRVTVKNGEMSKFATNDIKKWYQYPAIQLEMFEGSLKQVLSCGALSIDEKKEILKSYKKNMMALLFSYKKNAFDKSTHGQRAHYGFRPRIITTAEMLHWYAKLRGLKDVLKNEPVLYKLWNKGMFMDYARCIKRSIRLDIEFLKNSIRNRRSK